MRFFMRLLSIAFAFLFAPLAFVVRAVTFQPSPAEALAIDRLGRPVTVLHKARSRFLAFMDSARTHADFSSGHFDPGRMAA